MKVRWLLPAVFLIVGSAHAQEEKSNAAKSETAAPINDDWHASLYGGYSLLYDTEPSSGVSAGIAFHAAERLALRADFWTIRWPNARVLMLGPEFRPRRSSELARAGEHASFFEPFFNLKAGAIRNDTINYARYEQTGCNKNHTVCVIKGQLFADEEHHTAPAFSVGAGVELVWAHFFLRPADVNYLIGNVYRDGYNANTFFNHFQLISGAGFRF